MALTRIIPKPGLIIRDERGRKIPPDGLDVDLGRPYWRRHLKDEAIVVASPEAPAAPASDPAPPADATAPRGKSARKSED
jgi:hypothetical protein